MPEVGQHIGPFILQKWVSSTPTVSLYYASNPEGTRTLGNAAIRVLNNGHRNEEQQQLLNQDYSLLQSIDHPSFPSVYRNYISQHGYAREWIQGITLRELLNAHKNVKLTLDLPTIIDITLQVAKALQYLHNQRTPIVHGRLNLEHVLLAPNGDVFIVGLRANHQQNTPSYSSPEQAANAFVDWRSDQWGIGAMLTELLLKEPLYNGRQNIQYSAEKGDVAHWIRRIDHQHPNTGLGVFLPTVLHPAAGERFKSDELCIARLNSILLKIQGPSQRELIGSIANELAQGQLEKPPVLTKIPPSNVSKNTISISAVLPPSGPKISFEDIDLTEQIEPLLNAPHLEHPEHTSPQIVQQPTLTASAPEPNVHTDDDETENEHSVGEQTVPAIVEIREEFSESYSVSIRIPDHNDRRQQVTYLLIAINALSLLYLALQMLL